jgi:isocitrate dehydrogenase kinase/phosphatase
MLQQITDSRRSNLTAKAIHSGFQEYEADLNSIILRAKTRFETRDWHGVVTDSLETMDVYKHVVSRVVDEIEAFLKERLNDRQLWIGIKAVYSGAIDGRDDWELAETFFNSVTRRVFSTVGVDPSIEFVNADFETPSIAPTSFECLVHESPASVEELIATILSDFSFDVEYENLARDVTLVSSRVREYFRSIGLAPTIDRVEMASPVFYRGRAAYLIGRAFCEGQLFPFVLALENTENGIVVDAVLLEESLTSILFSFTHSYFRVLADKPAELVQFLRTIIPQKKVAELYISIGYNKHGKTELYRDLLQHLEDTDDQFEFSNGVPGMVMIVFTMPSHDVVFKVIRDRFAQPKTITRGQVLDKYRLVFKHDRAGRLVDAQEFEHLQFHRRNFSNELLEELTAESSRAVEFVGDQVILQHAYIERRLVPLNVYLAESDESAARAAVIDYGQSIKDLMVSNIFPGDLLTKNFGVTRHGRVVFYDFDELCFLTECRFRKVPKARHYEDELADEPWFSVGDSDVFPELFLSFLGLKGTLRDAFVEHHGDLLDADFWNRIQGMIRDGDMIRIFPYAQNVRLRA